MPFPTTGVLDNFNRADSASLGANWSGPVVAGDGRNGIVANEGDAIGTDASDYWNPSTFGPDSEAFVKLASFGTDDAHWGCWLRRVAGSDAYFFLYSEDPTVQYRYWRLDDDVYTQLGATITTPDLAVGDQIGAEIIGSTLTMYYKQGAGAWTAQATRTDATYGAAGNIGVQTSGNTTVRFDDFGGGTVVVGGALPRHRRIQAATPIISRAIYT